MGSKWHEYFDTTDVDDWNIPDFHKRWIRQYEHTPDKLRYQKAKDSFTKSLRALVDHCHNEEKRRKAKELLKSKYKRQLGNDLDALWCPREAELARTKLDSAQIDGITKYSSALTDAAVVNLNNVVERHRPSSDKDNPVRKRARTGLAIDDEELREDSDDYQPSAKPLMVNNKGPTSPTRRFSTYLQTTLLPSSPHSTADIPSVDNNEKVQQRIRSSSHAKAAPLLSKLAPSASVPPSYTDAEPKEHDNLDDPNEQLDIDLATIERLVMQESLDDWEVCNINVTKKFRQYQLSVIGKVKSSRLTWSNSYEILALASIFVLSPQCPYPNFTADEWHKIIATNPFTIEDPIVPPSISSALFEAGRKHALGLDGYMTADTSKLSRIAARTFNELMDIPDTAPTKITEELHCVRYLYPILRPIFFQPLKKYEVLMNSSVKGTKRRPDFSCTVKEIPILISEFKPLGCTPLQRQKDFIKMHLRGKKLINQQLCARGGPGEAAMFTNMGDMVVSSFMDLKFSALYRVWPFHTTKLVTDKASMPLLESVFCHFVALEKRMNVLAEDLSNRNNQFTPPAQMKFITEIPESPQIQHMLA